MVTHSSILAWKIPWTEEPGGLPCMGLQRVGHDRSNLALIYSKNILQPFWKPWGINILTVSTSHRARNYRIRIYNGEFKQQFVILVSVQPARLPAQTVGVTTGWIRHMLPFPFCLLLRSQMTIKEIGRDKRKSTDFGPNLLEPKYQLFHLDVTYPLWDSCSSYCPVVPSCPTLCNPMGTEDTRLPCPSLYGTVGTHSS